MATNMLNDATDTNEFEALFLAKMNAHDFYYIVETPGDVLGAYMDDDGNADVDEILESFADAWQIKHWDDSRIELWRSEHGIQYLDSAYLVRDGEIVPED